jgi:hypothetical protein
MNTARATAWQIWRNVRASTHARLAAALTVWLLGVSVPGSTVYASSTAFATQLRDGDTNLVRLGQGTAHYARFIPVYDAALYIDHNAGSQEYLDPGIAKRLDIVYRTSIKASDMVTAAERTLARQHSEATLARWRAEIDALHAAYRDVSSGDRYALVFQPGDGLRLKFNGKPVIHVAAAGFAQLYLGIWLGDPPLSARLKQALINHGNNPR